jgi:nucleotide-binding universal stress UspA family protein
VTKLPVGGKDGKIRVLFATDGSDHSAAAGKMLASVPFREDAELTIMNAVWSDFSDIPERFVLEINDRIKEMVADARSVEFIEAEKVIEEARKLLSPRFKKIDTLTKVGDPSTQILEVAGKVKADIIVVGCRGLRGIKGLMGSVSRNTLTHSACSVLLARACRG